MSFSLKPGERCPIPGHGYNCVCRASRQKQRASRWETVRHGVRRIKDDSVAAGYRYKLSPQLKREIINRRIREQGGICGLFQKNDVNGKLIAPDCPGKFTDYSDIVADHIEPRGMNGSRYDDGEWGENIQAAHSACNSIKGSRRVSAYNA